MMFLPLGKVKARLRRRTHEPRSAEIDEIVGKVLEYDKDPRNVVVDPEALYSVSN
jgi:hypothetical protein